MTGPCRLHHLSALRPDQRAALLRRPVGGLATFIARARPIVQAVKDDGDAALRRFAQAFDHATLAPGALQVREPEFDAAFAAVGEAAVATIRTAIANLRAVQEELRPEPLWLKEVWPGAYVGERWTPIGSVALYVPRGDGGFPAAAVMTAVPAVVAGVPRIAICTPPAADGSVDAATLVAARIAGVATIHKSGGAQAVAAVAYGTETVAATAKIVAPDSRWLAAAKRLLRGVIDTGAAHAAHEAIVFADETVDGRLAALDLLIAAEHGADASAFLVTHSDAVAAAALAAVPALLARMPPARRAAIRAVLSSRHGGIVLTASAAESHRFINDYAPAQLEILSLEPFRHLGAITRAARVQMGPHLPGTVTDLRLGPCAVLPCSRWTHSYGPLSVTDFLQHASIGHITGPVRPCRNDGFASAEAPLSAIRDDMFATRH